MESQVKYKLTTMRRLKAHSLLAAVVLALGSAAVSIPRLRAQDQEHPGSYSQRDIAAGAQLYTGQCASCHGTNGDTVGGVDLRRGRFRNVNSDDDLKRVVKTGVPGTAMPASNFSDAELNAIVAYIRAGFELKGSAVMIGDRARGRTLFEGKGQCGTCHRVGAQGPYLAPDLTDVGASRLPVSLQMSIVDPSATMQPINRPVRIVMKDGRTLRGRRLNEDTYSVQIIDDKERLVSLMKSDMKEYEVITTSPMPSYRGKLSNEEIADLVAYLLSLRG
jgi:putative heme-binding domain-containing protein